MFGFNLPIKGMPLEEACMKLTPLMNMVFYCMDKVKRIRLSKEGKTFAKPSGFDFKLHIVKRLFICLDFH